MTDTTVFDPTDKKLEIRTGDAEVSLYLGDDLVAHCQMAGCEQWDDTKILAYFYLESLFHRGCAISGTYNESIFTLILNTLHASGHEDFVTADWTAVKYEVASMADTNAAVYVTVTTTDGFDITLDYMTPGLAWQQLIVRHNEEVPTVDELYAKLSGKDVREWTSNGTVFYKGIVYNYDAAATQLFTMQHRLQILEEGGEVLYSDEDAQGRGLIEVLMDLYRKLQLNMNYGDVVDLNHEHRQQIQANLGEMLTDTFAMGEFLELVDQTSHSIRGSVTEDVMCLISHTYLADAGKVRADFRFFTVGQGWQVENSKAFSLEEAPILVNDVYNQNRAQIRAGLGLDAIDLPTESLADIPFDNRETGYDAPQPMFTPVEQEEILDEDPEAAFAGDPLEVTAVVAVGPRGGIGQGNDLLFRIKEDLQFFKQATINHVIIMGRKTFESIGKPLAGRQNIVISRDPEYVLNLYGPDNDEQYDNLHSVTSVEEAILLGGRLAAEHYGNNELMVIGGGQIYKEFIPMTSKILMTSVNVDDSNADTFFPVTGQDIASSWDAAALATGLNDGNVTYDRYVLTRKQ